MADVYALVRIWYETLCFRSSRKAEGNQTAAEKHITLQNAQFLFFARFLLATPCYPLLLRTALPPEIP